VRPSILILCVLTSLVGCRSTPPAESRSPDEFHEQAIYAALKHEPVPIPQSTLYGSDARQQQSFADGFRNGWERAISGALLHGTFGTPANLSADVREAWTAGWKSGTKIGSDRWMAKSQELRERNGQSGSRED